MGIISRSSSIIRVLSNAVFITILLFTPFWFNLQEASAENDEYVDCHVDAWDTWAQCDSDANCEEQGIDYDTCEAMYYCEEEREEELESCMSLYEEPEVPTIEEIIEEEYGTEEDDFDPPPLDEDEYDGEWV